MNSLIDVFRMHEVSKEVRCDIIIKLGNAINSDLGLNATEPLVYELVNQLCPDHAHLRDKRFLTLAGIIEHKGKLK